MAPSIQKMRQVLLLLFLIFSPCVKCCSIQKNQRINYHQSTTDSDTLFQLTKLADAPLRAARNKATLVFAAERTPLRTAR
jgi:hypothetical protein